VSELSELSESDGGVVLGALGALHSWFLRRIRTLDLQERTCRVGIHSRRWRLVIGCVQSLPVQEIQVIQVISSLFSLSMTCQL
jgi:hypothetical protein